MFAAALKEATDTINADKRAAAELCIAEAKSKESVEDVYRIVADPSIEFAMMPRQIGNYAQFMYEDGLIKNGPASWKDLFFENVHGLPGN